MSMLLRHGESKMGLMVPFSRVAPEPCQAVPALKPTAKHRSHADLGCTVKYMHSPGDTAWQPPALGV
jgi:hypothetical protein